MMTPLEYTKGLKGLVYKFEFENGHRALVIKEFPSDLFEVTSTCKLFCGKNLTNKGVAMFLDGLSNLGRKKKNGNNE